MKLDEALEFIYTALANNNEDIDLHIKNLRETLNAAGEKQAVINPEKLFQNNRGGRKIMQAYFKKRGVKILFKQV